MNSVNFAGLIFSLVDIIKPSIKNKEKVTNWINSIRSDLLINKFSKYSYKKKQQISIFIFQMCQLMDILSTNVNSQDKQ